MFGHERGAGRYGDSVGVQVVERPSERSPITEADIPYAEVRTFSKKSSPQEKGGGDQIQNLTGHVDTSDARMAEIERSYRTGKPIVVTIAREEYGGKITCIYGGEQFVPADSPKDPTGASDDTYSTYQTGETLQLTSPEGTIGKRISKEDLEKIHSGFNNWKRVETAVMTSPIGDVLGKATGAMGADGHGLEIKTLLVSPQPFCVTMEMHPYDEASVEEMKKAVARRTFTLGQSVAPEDKTEHKGYTMLLQSLDTDQKRGRFQPNILVGGKTEADAERTAGYVATAAGSEQLSYTVDVSDQTYANISEARAGTSTSELASLGIPNIVVNRILPRKPTSEIPGLPQEQMVEFAQNIPSLMHIPDNRKVRLGKITNEYGTPVGEAAMDIKTFDQHIEVYGATGSGKTTLLKLLSVKARRLGMPVIFFDPKGTKEGKPGIAEDLSNMLDKDGIKVTKIKLGESSDVSVGFNPLDPGKEDLSTHIENVLTILTNAFGVKPGQDEKEASEATKRFLRRALLGDQVRRGKKRFIGLYEQMGWDPSTGKPLPKFEGSKPMYPTMNHLITALTDAAKAQGYEGDAKNVVPFLEQRQEEKSSGKVGNVFNSPTINFNAIFSTKDNGGVTVIETKGLTDTEYSLLVGFMQLYFRSELERTGQRACMVIDEFSKFVKRDSPLADDIAKLISTTREFGGSIIYADQDPSMVPSNIHRNTGASFVMRVKDAAEASQVITMTNQQAEATTRFGRGEFAAYFSDHGMQNGPIHGRVLDLTNELMGDAKPLAPETIISDDYHRERIVSLEESNKYVRRLFETDEGMALFALADTITCTTGFGLDKQVGINFDILRENRIFTYDNLRELPKKERDYIVDAAVEIAIYEHSLELLPLFAKGQAHEGKSLDYMMDIVKEKVHAALNGAVDTTYDSSHVMPGYEGMADKAKLYKQVADVPEYEPIKEIINISIGEALANGETVDNVVKRVRDNVQLTMHGASGDPEIEVAREVDLQIKNYRIQTNKDEKDATVDLFDDAIVRAVKEHSDGLLAIFPKGTDLNIINRIMKSQIQIALKTATPPDMEEPTSVPQAFIEYTRATKQQYIPANPDVNIPGDTVIKQMENLEKRYSSTHPVLLKRKSYGDGIPLDNAVGGVLLQDAIAGKNIDPWIKGYKKHLAGLVIAEATQHFMFNEVKGVAIQAQRITPRKPRALAEIIDSLAAQQTDLAMQQLTLAQSQNKQQAATFQLIAGLADSTATLNKALAQNLAATRAQQAEPETEPESEPVVSQTE